MTSSALAQNFQWSDLARRSSEVGQALDEFGEVSVTRGAQTLRLSAAETHPILDTTRDLCRVLTALVELDEPAQVRRVLNAAWPWTRALPSEDQVELAREVGDVGEMCESLNTWGPLIESLNDWRRTARAWAEGARPVAITDVLEHEATRPA
jgi:hypothetical protein